MLHPDREGRLTASLHGQALGFGYDSAPESWRRYHGQEPSPEAQERMQWGKEHERDAVGFFESCTGELCDLTGDAQVWVPHEGWSGCTPDGFLGDIALVEFKCPMRIWDEPPVNYWCQVQSQLYITNRTICYLTAWTPDSGAIWQTTRDEDYWPQAEPHLRAYHQMLLSESPPKRWRKPALNFKPKWERIE